MKIDPTDMRSRANVGRVPCRGRSRGKGAADSTTGAVGGPGRALSGSGAVQKRRPTGVAIQRVQRQATNSQCGRKELSRQNDADHAAGDAAPKHLHGEGSGNGPGQGNGWKTRDHEENDQAQLIKSLWWGTEPGRRAETTGGAQREDTH